MMMAQSYKLIVALLAAFACYCDCAVPDKAVSVVGARKLATAHDCNGAIAFSALGAQPKAVGSKSKLAFRNVLADKGVGWSKDSGEFTCFCPGLYQFSFAGSGTPATRLSLKKKLSTSKEWTTIVSTGPGGGANFAITDMDIGDQAAVWLEAGELFPDVKTSSFSLFRLAKK
uniref:C1q domain-containing protein n=1 Tax=Timema bartmani TaxID=61472 RepID=A0A7R9F137_9NEOP|nr:unnamed protein product [Timema bartmani]